MGTNINAVSSLNSWAHARVQHEAGTVTNYGSIRQAVVGSTWTSSGSTLILGDDRYGNGGVGVLLPNGGVVTNEQQRLHQRLRWCLDRGRRRHGDERGFHHGTSARSSVASGSVDNQSGGILSTISGEFRVTAYVGNCGSVTNAGTIIISGTNTSAVPVWGRGTVNDFEGFLRPAPWTWPSTP